MSTSRTHLAQVAKQTLAAVERGHYVAPSGRRVDVRDAVEAAVRGTTLFRPGDFDPHRLDDEPPAPPGAPAPRVEVTAETTAAAARRLVEAEGVARVVLLNFASAKNPGGGFLSGARAQEEDLARASALYPCQLSQRAYYDANRACGSMLYTDHVLHSPDVPFVRDEGGAWLEAPFLASVITAPAPNAGEARGRERGDRVRAALASRAGKVLAVARARGHRAVVLGAWGCGVFRNDPRHVADAFARWLAAARYAGAFDRVTFAVYDRGAGRPTLRAFEERFAR
jgi:uncharacterized protein (TIGR02452 family)